MLRTLVLATLGCLSISGVATATCPAFTTLTNGSAADANQVMNNFNYILQCPNFTGNVGVGTTAPADPIDVNGAAVFGLSGAPRFSIDYDDIGFNRRVQTGAIYYSGAYAYQLTHSWSTTASSDNLAFQVYNPSGANITAGALAITGQGYVGINILSPSYVFQVNGTAYATGAAGALSDIRHKDDVKSLPSGALDLVTKLRPVSFRWKDPKDDGMKGTQMGFVAQEVEKILPTVVLTQTDKEKTKGLKYNEIVALLTKALQEQQAEIRDQQDHIKKLEIEHQAEIKKLKTDQEAQIEDLKNTVAALKSSKIASLK